MPGRWNPAAPPKRPGSYSNFVARPVQRVNAPLAGIVAMPIVADWGPIGSVVASANIGEYKSVYGESTYMADSPGYVAAYQVFKGEGIKNRGGAAELLTVRMAGTAAKQAQAKFADTLGSPNAEAIIVKALYKGTLGNKISAQFAANATEPSTKYDLVVYLNGAEVERWTYTKATNSTLTAIVNGKSDWVEVEVKKSEAPQALTTKVLTEGNNGATLEAADWTGALTALGTKRFSVFVPFDLTTEAVQTSINTWATAPETGANSKGRRFEVVEGGKSADSLAEAISRSALANNENVVNVGAFTVTDTEITDSTGAKVVLSSSQFAPRIAGVIAATGGSSSVTFSRFADVSLVTGLSEDVDFVKASEKGVLTLAQDSNALAPVRVEQDVTTYIEDTTAKPKEIFGTLKFVRTMQSFEMRITEWAENEEVIGKLGVSRDTKEYIIGQATKIMELEYIVPGEIQKEDSTVFISPDPPATAKDNFIPVTYEFNFGRDLRQIRNTIVVG